MANHFVLIHGAWHGGWCWEEVIKELERAGHTAEAPTMPGHQPEDDRSQITFGDYVDQIVRLLRQQAEPVVLVGHSSAGFLLQAAAPKAADKVAHLIFVNGFILPNGHSQFDLVPPEASQALTAAAQASPDNTVPVIEDFVRGVLMAGEPVELQDKLISKLVPQPLALFSTPVDTTAFEQLRTPKTIVYCKNDSSLPPGAYLGMAQGLGEHTLIEVDGGHEALFTEPKKVVAALLRSLE